MTTSPHQTDLFATRRPVPGTTYVAFDGPSYDAKQDKARLAGLLGRVYDLMRDGEWRTPDEVRAVTGGASVDARLRDLRKEKFGEHTVLSRPRQGAPRGVWEYRVCQ